MAESKGCGCSLLEVCPICTFEPFPSSQPSADAPVTSPAQPAEGEEGGASEAAKFTIAPSGQVIPFGRKGLTSVGSAASPPRPEEPAPRATLIDCLKELIRLYETGERDMSELDSIIVIPCSVTATNMPILLGADMPAALMLGKLEFSKLMLGDWMIENG